ncbi:ISLre2 family transposase, partial [Salmonella enterica subsp. enterica serovar Typhimurium]|uniref:UPF0236 family transposase-like protein n=1 Tax=Salmonella enterica TaxID=28901 RepID=UPI000CB4F8ED
IRYSPLVEMKASVMASKTTYRTAAKSIRFLTPVEMSHTTGHSMTQKIGHTIQEWTDHVLSMDRIPLRKKKKVPVLYIEGDGLMLSKGAQEKRPILHRVQIHEGVKEKGTRKHPRP